VDLRNFHDGVADPPLHARRGEMRDQVWGEMEGLYQDRALEVDTRNLLGVPRIFPLGQRAWRPMEFDRRAMWDTRWRLRLAVIVQLE
jgi:hypothetical protein